MKRCLMMMFFALLCVSAAVAQEKKAVPPPPKPKDEGPSLEVTMKFIQDKLNGVGPVNYVVYIHDDIKGSEQTPLKLRQEYTRVVVDAVLCRVSFHYRQEVNGAGQDSDGWLSLKAVGEMVVMGEDQSLKEDNTADGHPERSYKVDPPVFVLKQRWTDAKGINYFPFRDEQMANRVAKAMVHAVELCGGGSKPEPF